MKQVNIYNLSGNYISYGLLFNDNQYNFFDVSGNFESYGLINGNQVNVFDLSGYNSPQN